jgi:hypothetical protein
MPMTCPMEKTETDIFADDTTLSISDVSLNRVVESLTPDLLNANKWCDSNRMSINANKTKVKYISSKHKQNYICESDPKTEQIYQKLLDKEGFIPSKRWMFKRFDFDTVKSILLFFNLILWFRFSVL